MSLSIAQLERLLDKLENLTAQLRSSSQHGEDELTNDDPVVELANECEFMLPSPLTVVSLRATAERKIGNVVVLLERARQNQDIPLDAQLAADNEDMLLRPPSGI
jgi:hypothetical protein